MKIIVSQEKQQKQNLVGQTNEHKTLSSNKK
jgi:hypothetical protein